LDFIHRLVSQKKKAQFVQWENIVTARGPPSFLRCFKY